MKDPKHPVGPAFEKAADALQAWREWQKAALDDRAREDYGRIREDTEKRKREAASRYWAQREAAVETEKRHLLLEKPDLALRMLPSQKMRESMAYGKAADLVRRRHEMELQSLERECERSEDAFLKEQEEQRERAKEMSEQMRTEFNERGGVDNDALGEALRARADAKRRDRDRDRDDEGRER